MVSDVWELAIRQILADVDAEVAVEKVAAGERQFHLSTGEIIGLLDTGSVSLQGRRTDLSADLQKQFDALGISVVELKDQPMKSGTWENHGISAGAPASGQPDNPAEPSTATVTFDILLRSELSDAVRGRFDTRVGRYARDLAHEMELLDAEGNGEYTCEMVRKADLLLRRGSGGLARKAERAADLSFFTASTCAGILGNYFTHSTWQTLAFGVLLTLAAAIFVFRTFDLGRAR